MIDKTPKNISLNGDVLLGGGDTRLNCIRYFFNKAKAGDINAARYLEQILGIKKSTNGSNIRDDLNGNEEERGADIVVHLRPIFCQNDEPCNRCSDFTNTNEM